MSVILYKQDASGNVVSEFIKGDGNKGGYVDVAPYLKAGYKTSRKAFADAEKKVEAVEQTADKEIRDAAKKAGISSWHLKSVQKLKKELNVEQQSEG